MFYVLSCFNNTMWSYSRLKCVVKLLYFALLNRWPGCGLMFISATPVKSVGKEHFEETLSKYIRTVRCGRAGHGSWLPPPSVSIYTWGKGMQDFGRMLPFWLGSMFTPSSFQIHWPNNKEARSRLALTTKYCDSGQFPNLSLSLSGNGITMCKMPRYGCGKS